MRESGEQDVREPRSVRQPSHVRRQRGDRPKDSVPAQVDELRPAPIEDGNDSLGGFGLNLDDNGPAGSDQARCVRVLPAYAYRCTVCRLREARLLDAAHIVADGVPGGEPVVENGLSLCSIQHRAFDQNLIGISPDYAVNVHPRLLDEEDGPMLDLLKEAHETRIVLPRQVAHRPDRERLERRFEQFRAAS